MHDPWTHLKSVFERTLANLEQKDGLQARSNLKAVVHTARTIGEKAEGPERDRAGMVYKAAEKATHMLDPGKALEILRTASAAFEGAPSTPMAAPPAPPANL